jgi:YYY domain-containing protein
MAPLAVAAWLAVLALVWAGGAPVAAWLFPGFPDRGVALGLPVGLVVFGLATFWAGHLSLAWAPAAGLGAVLAAGVAVRRREPRTARGDWRRPLAAFSLAFGAALALRFVDPGIAPTGGEAFFDFGLVRSLLETGALPPEDHWFAGEPVRYYYGGHLLVAGLAGLSGAAPAVAYNLGVATAFAVLATAVYGLAGALVPDRPGLAGGLGVAFAALGGHLATPARALLGVVPESVAAPALPVYVGYRTTPAEGLAAARRIATGWYDYWPARHVIPGHPTAFPMWTFVNGDLRPHMVGAGALVLGAALCLAYYRTPATDRRRRGLLLFGAVPAVAGLLVVVDTWAAPTVLGLAWVTAVHAPGSPLPVLPGLSRTGGGSAGGWVRALGRELRRTLAATVTVAAAAGLAAAVAAPFLSVPPPVNRGVGAVTDPDGLAVLVLAYGGFLAAFALAGLRSLRGRTLPVCRTATLSLALGGIAVVAALAAADLAPLAVFGVPLAVGWGWLRRRRSGGGPVQGSEPPDGAAAGTPDPRGFAAVLVVAGAGLALVTAFVYARVWPFDPGAPRWNTAYKAGFYVWLLWGAAAGAALARVLRGRPAGPDGGPETGDADPDDRGPSRVAAAAAAALLVCVLAFPTFALVAHFDDPGEHPGPAFTLDGRAYAEAERPAEAAAADWLADRPGRPTVVERPGTSPYQWRNVPSTLSGLPTVAGWNHEAGYHGLDPYLRRVGDVRRIYEGNRSTACRLLSAYGVDYVYVGPAERAGYDLADPARIPGVERAHATANATVYRVDDPCGRSTGARAGGRPAGG